MDCYKNGGCGVYENRSCNECPASKPEYLNKNKCGYCSNFHIREPEVKTIEMYHGKDKEGCEYYYLDVERPEGFIPEPWRNRRLYIRYCPLCGRKLT